MRTPTPQRREPTTRHGEVLLSANHIALLHGLYDRPGGLATSSADLVRAAVPYLRLFRSRVSVSCLAKSARTLHHAWATPHRFGRCIGWQLTARGAAIVERATPARIRARGPYTGMRELLQQTLPTRRHEATAAHWARRVRDPAFAPLAAELDVMLQVWTRRRPSRHMYAVLQTDHLRKGLTYYARAYVLRHGTLPRGTHVLVGEKHGCNLTVNFDELRRPDQ